MELQTARQLSLLPLCIAFTIACATWLYCGHDDPRLEPQLVVLAVLMLAIIFQFHMWRTERSTVKALKQQCLEVQEKCEAFQQQFAALEELEGASFQQARQILWLEKKNVELVSKQRKLSGDILDRRCLLLDLESKTAALHAWSCQTARSRFAKEVENLSQEKMLLQGKLLCAQEAIEDIHFQSQSKRWEASAELHRQVSETREAEQQKEAIAQTSKENKHNLQELKRELSQKALTLQACELRNAHLEERLCRGIKDEIAVMRVAQLMLQELPGKGAELIKTQKRLLLCVHPDKCPAVKTATMLMQELKESRAWMSEGKPEGRPWKGGG